MSAVQAVEERTMRFLISTMAMVCVTAVLCGCARDATGSAPDAARGAAVPDLAHMALAAPVGGKIGVPVDVHYQLQGVAAKNQPATLQLAFVPRVAGSNLQVEFPASPTVAIENGAAAFSIGKADATGVYRRSLLVTPRAADAGEVRAIVSMEVDGGRYAGIFNIPVGSGGTPERAGKDRPGIIR